MTAQEMKAMENISEQLTSIADSLKTIAELAKPVKVYDPSVKAVTKEEPALIHELSIISDALYGR